MNATNRGVNRLILLIVGVLLLTAGGATVLASLWSSAATAWQMSVDTGVAWMVNADDVSRVSDATTVSWFTFAVLVTLLLVVLIAGLVIGRLGGGRSSILMRAGKGDGAQGSVTIGRGFASDAIVHSLAAHEDILSSRVAACRVRGTDVLHVRITPRQNTSPVEIAATVNGLLDNLSALTGQHTPTYVSIHSGIRARASADRSRVN